MELTAKRLQEQHGELLQEQYADVGSPYLLHRALTGRDPPIRISYAAVRTWFAKYRVNTGDQCAKNAEELDEKYGDILRASAVENSSSYKLCSALRCRDPPLYLADGLAKQWLKKYHLENVEWQGRGTSHCHAVLYTHW